MRRLAIDFAPPRRPHPRGGWLAGGAGVFLAAALGATWLATAPVEASHMATTAARPLPDAVEAQAIDAAVGALNEPWIELLDALAVAFDPVQGVRLLRTEVDMPNRLVRLHGEAGDSAAAQALPARLRAHPVVAAAQLAGLENGEPGTARPLGFVLELRIGEAP